MLASRIQFSKCSDVELFYGDIEQEKLEAHQVLVEEILKTLKIKYPSCTFSSRCDYEFIQSHFSLFL